MAAGEVLTVNTSTHEVTNTFADVPLHGGVLADADLSTDADGVERFVYPTGEGDRVVALDPASGAVLATAESKKGGHPTRLTASPDGSIWVQEAGKHSVAVYEPSTLELVKRFQTGTQPILGTFTYDGAYAYTGHADDNFVQVVDTAKLRALAHIRVRQQPADGGRAPRLQPHLRHADRTTRLSPWSINRTGKSTVPPSPPPRRTRSRWTPRLSVCSCA